MMKCADQPKLIAMFMKAVVFVIKRKELIAPCVMKLQMINNPEMTPG